MYNFSQLNIAIRISITETNYYHTQMFYVVFRFHLLIVIYNYVFKYRTYNIFYRDLMIFYVIPME